jgi:cytochrome d ubiquinol oxidase subunit II
LYTLIYLPHLSERLKSHPIFFVFPALVFLCIANIPRLVARRKYRIAFLFSSLTVSLLLALVALGLYPTLLVSTVDSAYDITIYNGASSDKSLGIMLLLAVIGAPMVLSYTIFVFYTFRGKVKLDETSY